VEGDRVEPPEDEAPTLPGSPQPVGCEVCAQWLGEGDSPAARAALRLDRSDLRVPALLDADEPALEVDVVPAEGLKLAGAKAAVEGGCPHGAVPFGERL